MDKPRVKTETREGGAVIIGAAEDKSAPKKKKPKEVSENAGQS